MEKSSHPQMVGINLSQKDQKENKVKYKIYVQYLDSRENGYWLNTIYSSKEAAEWEIERYTRDHGKIKWYEVREYEV